MAYSKETTARHLRAQMALAGMRTEDLSKASGVSIDTIRKVLRGEGTPMLKTACEFAYALGCTPNDICGWNEQA